jgi:uncharacterized membrane protein HdeD (DUF308 family)
MACNLGNIERGIRIALGVVLIGVGYLADLPTGAAVAVYLVGAVAVITGLAGFCPAWKLLGINTCAAKSPAKG